MPEATKLIRAETVRTDEMRNAGLMATDGAADTRKQPPSLFFKPALPGLPDLGVSVLTTEAEATERNQSERASVQEGPSKFAVGPVGRAAKSNPDRAVG